MDFSIRLKVLRAEKGLNQAQLASLLGLSRSTIAMYESGQREPDFQTIDLLTKIFDVSTDYLIGLSNIKKATPTTEIIEVGTIKIAGRDGSFVKRELTDEQLDIVKRMIEQMPDYKG